MLKALRGLKTETFALYYAIRDPRTPLAAKIVAGAVVAYALSPIDLIPDFIPVLGHLDDLVLVPLGIALSIRMIPEQVMYEARLRAQSQVVRAKNYGAAIAIVIAWVTFSALLAWWIFW
jgi:uncharacterized membrane protein YkvA (DUF1232 family)